MLNKIKQWFCIHDWKSCATWGVDYSEEYDECTKCGKRERLDIPTGPHTSKWKEPEEGTKVICHICGEINKYNSMFPCLKCGEYETQHEVADEHT